MISAVLHDAWPKLAVRSELSNYLLLFCSNSELYTFIRCIGHDVVLNWQRLTLRMLPEKQAGCDSAQLSTHAAVNVPYSSMPMQAYRGTCFCRNFQSPSLEPITSTTLLSDWLSIHITGSLSSRNSSQVNQSIKNKEDASEKSCTFSDW